MAVRKRRLVEGMEFAWPLVSGREWALVLAGRKGHVVVAGRPRQLALYEHSVGHADRRMAGVIVAHAVSHMLGER